MSWFDYLYGFALGAGFMWLRMRREIKSRARIAFDVGRGFEREQQAERQGFTRERVSHN